MERINLPADPCLLYCGQCTGFWVGTVVGLLLCINKTLSVLEAVAFAFTVSIVSYLVGTWLYSKGEHADVARERGSDGVRTGSGQD